MRAHTTWSRILPPTITFVAIIVVWQLVAVIFRMPQYLLPSPTDVAVSVGQNWSVLLSNAWITTYETVIGFVFAAIVAIPIAIAIVYSRGFERASYPLLVASQTVPKIAIAPLFVVWFGFGLIPKVLNAGLISFFPIVISTVVGLQSVAPEMLQLTRSMGASQWTTFRKIRLPAATPSIFGGLKVGMTLAVVGAVVGEFVGSNSGLGYLLLTASGDLNTPLVFAAIVVLTITGVILFYIVAAAEMYFTRWHPRSRGDELYAATA